MYEFDLIHIQTGKEEKICNRGDVSYSKVIYAYRDSESTENKIKI